MTRKPSQATRKNSRSSSTELKRITEDISEIKEKLLEKRPSPFRSRDLVNASFSSLLFGMLFVFKGNMINIARLLTPTHMIAIVAITAVALTAQIYFIGYTRVVNPEERRFGQFWAKRFFTLYGISVVASTGLLFLYNVDLMLGSDIIKMIVAVSMPCAVGAAIPSLLKQY